MRTRRTDPLPRRRVVAVDGGRGARLQLAVIRAVGNIAGVFGLLGGLQRFAVWLGRWFSPDNAVTLAVPCAGLLRIPLRDGYWVRLLFGRFRYEPEIDVVLAGIPDEDLGFFLDCGANIGLWSLVAAHRIGDPTRVMAIEASPSVFARLSETAALNRNAFRPIHGALWSIDDVELTLTARDEAHPANSVADLGFQVEAGGYEEKVRSITLDTLWRRVASPNAGGVVVKLDVEGAEFEALRGARDLLRSQFPLVIYEDHGSDTTSALTRFILDELGLRVFFCDRRGVVVQIGTVEQAAARKHNRYQGYNFFACAAGSRFASIMENLAGSR